MKKKYELMAIISGQITDRDIQARVSGLKEILGSEITFEETWGMRPFAYQIKGQEKGYYVVYNFMAEGEHVKEMEMTLRLYPDLLRFLLITVPEGYKPITKAEVDAGLEALTKAKADKRGAGRSARDKRSEDEKKKPVMPEKMEKAPEAKAAAPVKAPEAPVAPKKTKSLDEKLKDIMSDDDLGL